jgi:H+/gluconate symporter-like permease
VRKQDTAWFVALGAGLMSAVALLRRRVRVALFLALGAIGAGIASRRIPVRAAPRLATGVRGTLQAA